MPSDEELIQGCLRNEPESQELFYKRFAPRMYGVCMRFAKNQMEAEDILQEGFIRVFVNLKTYRGEGSLEGWIRRTIVNTAINLYKKNLKHLKDTDIEAAGGFSGEEENALDKLSLMELLQIIQDLPDGYRMVFNLNAIDGYTHREIGEMLDISENTSKSQLSRARNALKKKINNLEEEK